jgi:hypothetical protein
MIKSIFILVLTLLIFLVVQNVTFGQAKRCLFIGDSYFSHNDLSKEFQAVWNDEISDTLLIATHNRDGATIVSQWRRNSNDLLQLFVSQMWDYVIIELPRLATPQDSSLVQILRKIDSSLKNCRIICITMDFCNSFPEMACVRDPDEGVKCNEYLNCKEKSTQVRATSESIVNQNYKNSIQIIPFSQYKYFLHDQYSIELGSDDDYGHPSPFSQSVLARFLLFHIMNHPGQVDIIKTNKVSSEAIHISSFYSTYNNESNN